MRFSSQESTREGAAADIKAEAETENRTYGNTVTESYCESTGIPIHALPVRLPHMACAACGSAPDGTAKQCIVCDYPYCDSCGIDGEHICGRCWRATTEEGEGGEGKHGLDPEHRERQHQEARQHDDREGPESDKTGSTGGGKKSKKRSQSTGGENPSSVKTTKKQHSQPGGK